MCLPQKNCLDSLSIALVTETGNLKQDIRSAGNGIPEIFDLMRTNLH